MLHAVIMAGGSGSRLWPESRSYCPKQLLAIGSDYTLIQKSVLRLLPLVPTERIYVATNPRLGPALLGSINQLAAPGGGDGNGDGNGNGNGDDGSKRGAFRPLTDSSLILEPVARNTAACIGLAAVRCLQEDPDAVMAVMTSDHLISPVENFAENVRFAAKLVEESPERLVIFGIRPAYAAESFGYIQRGELAAETSDRLPATADSQRAFHVVQFKEKPPRETAEEYICTGHNFWNSGMFLWKARTILDRLREYQPDLGAAFDRIGESWNTPNRDSVIDREFAAMRSVSIDCAVMERAPNVLVVEANFDWDDVGSWGALERLRPRDENGNTIDAPHCITIQTKGTIVRNQDPSHLIALVGVQDLAVVHTPDATLIINKRDEEAVRKVVQELKQSGLDVWI